MSLLLPMILCLVLMLAGCESTEQISQIEIPSFDLLKPTRPELVEIPTELVAALKTMAINMSKMDGYISQLEIYCKNVNDYIAQLQIILTTKSDNKYIQRK